MQKTGIEYLTHTWNPIAMRCTRVSDGCDNCWHLRMAHRHAHNPKLTEEMRSARGGGDFALLEDELSAPLRLRKPAVIGVQFMGDLFHESVPFEWVAAVIEIIASCKEHVFVILTKRPGRMYERLIHLTQRYPAYVDSDLPGSPGWPIPNLYLGVSIEDQPTADERLIYLRDVPAAKRLVSYEPAIGPWDPVRTYAGSMNVNALEWIDLVIAGAETGPGKRPAELRWFYDVRDQCAEAAVPFFFKKTSGGSDLLDGRLHREMPG